MIQKKSQGKRKVALSVENEGSRCFEAERTGAAPRILAIRVPSPKPLGRIGAPVLPNVGNYTPVGLFACPPLDP